MRKKTAISFIFCLQTALSLHASDIVKTSFVQEGQFVIESLDIHVIGTNSQPKEVSQKLKTKKGGIFSQAEFDEDLRKLAKDYDHIDPNVKFSSGKASIRIKLIAKPTIRNIKLKGNKHLNNYKILKILKINEKETFEREIFLKAFEELKTYYLKRGFFESEISYDLKHNEHRGYIDISLDIEEGFCGKIKCFNINGLTKSEKNDVREFIQTKQHSKLSSWFDGSGLYHPEIIEQDSLAITNYLQNLGYADASAKASYTKDKYGNMLLNLDVNKGKKYHLAHVHIKGFTVLPNKIIEKQLLLGPNDLYCPEKIWIGAQKIKNIYAKYGYINANIDIEFKLHPKLPYYDVYYIISEGSPYKVGLIKITGNINTKQDVILHETAIYPGDIFNKTRLEKTEQSLRNTGYFKNVSVYTTRSQLDPLNNDDEYKDVYIEVSETSTGNLGVFLGFSSLDNLFGGVELSENNFDLFGARHFLRKGFRSLRGGGEYLFLKANFGDKVTDYTLKWTKPHFLNTPWILGVELDKSINRALSNEYKVENYGGNVSTTYILNQYLKYGIYYRGNQTNLYKKEDSNNIGPNVADNRGFVSATGVNLAFDSTDSQRNPKNGIRSKVNFEVSGLGGKYHFTKFTASNSIYRKISKKCVLKIKGETQFIKPYGETTADGIPVSERFFLGGETTVRGFKPFIIGPKFSPEEPKGGLSSLLVSEEIQYPIVNQPNINIFAFLDAGYISTKEYYINVKELSASAGFGFRFDVMNNVPIMLGFGWPFQPTEIFNGEKIDVSQRFFFALGGIF